MEISETHKNGAKITVKGRGAHKIVRAWREEQDKKPVEEEPEEPKVKGASSSISGPVSRYYDTDSYFSYNPVPQAFGFVPNEENWRWKGLDNE